MYHTNFTMTACGLLNHLHPIYVTHISLPKSDRHHEHDLIFKSKNVNTPTFAASLSKPSFKNHPNSLTSTSKSKKFIRKKSPNNYAQKSNQIKNQAKFPTTINQTSPTKISTTSMLFNNNKNSPSMIFWHQSLLNASVSTQTHCLMRLANFDAQNIILVSNYTMDNTNTNNNIKI